VRRHRLRPVLSGSDGAVVDTRVVIVVGLDGSPGSKAALQWALDEARLRGWPVRAVLAFPASAAVPSAGFDPVPIDIEGFDNEAEAALAALVEQAGDTSDVEIERVAIPGPPAQVLIDESEEAKLLVVGSRGIGGVAGLVLGSVSTQIAHHASCPVLIVRAPSEK
jgi:nucleotide-binding universal stress UspA family protein